MARFFCSPYSGRRRNHVSICLFSLKWKTEELLRDSSVFLKVEDGGIMARFVCSPYSHPIPLSLLSVGTSDFSSEVMLQGSDADHYPI
jgi:hypothetical protein